MKKPGRNDPCPCGSGKKFKHCHLGKEDELTLGGMGAFSVEMSGRITALPEVWYGRSKEMVQALDLKKLTGVSAGIRFVDLAQIAANVPAPFVAMLDGVEDPYNFGQAVRALYAAGAHGLILRPRNWLTAAGVVARACGRPSAERQGARCGRCPRRWIGRAPPWPCRAPTRWGSRSSPCWQRRSL